MTSLGGPSEFSAAVLAEFVKRGVRHVVVCPGSRSQALALAAAEFERAGLLTLSVRIDERSAGFLALGVGVESGVPAIVITTSGTAVANLLPAVLEAHHSGVPMILLTADRPEQLRGIGSNQTTHQLGMFGNFVRFATEVEAPSAGDFDRAYPGQLATKVFLAATGHSGAHEHSVADRHAAVQGHSGAAGPVQVNMAFTEPLSGSFDHSILADVAAASTHVSPSRVVARTAIPVAPNTVVVAGHGAGPDAEAVAHALGAPLLAEVSSGAHFGRNLVVAYRELLGTEEFGAQVRRVIVFGHPTLSREVPQLIQRDGVETIVVRGRTAEDYNPGHRVARFVDALDMVPGAGAINPDAIDAGWVGSWVVASRRLLAGAEFAGGTTTGSSSVGGATARAAGLVEPTPIEPVSARTDDRAAIREFTKAQLAVFREPVTRRMLVEAVWQSTWPHDRLVFASSRLIREADRVVPGKNIRVHANRGLAGIDGTIATATGIALSSQLDAGHFDARQLATSHVEAGQDRTGGNAAAGTTRVLLGDLAFLHDVGSLLSAPGEISPRIQLVVGNDGGGTIFDSLEVAESAEKHSFDRVLYTPHTVNVADLAAAYGWNYLRAENRGQLDEALVTQHERTIIEVPLPRKS